MGGDSYPSDPCHVLADALPHLVWTADRDGRIEYFNSRRGLYASAHDWYGYGRLVHPDDRAPTERAWASAASAEAPYEFEHRMQMADGSYCWHLSRAVPIRSRDGRSMTWFGTATDVHERVVARRELDTAVHTLQHSLLPHVASAPPGWELAWRYRPAVDADEVGGDWYDVIVAPPYLTLVIGDVAGHGIEAASVMGAARHAVATLASSAARPAQILLGASRYLAREGDVLVTCAVIRIDTRSGWARLASAGHLSILIVRGLDFAEFAPVRPGPPLAVVDDPEYVEHDLALPPGTGIILYTDGLVERRGRGIDEGLAHLRDLAHALVEADAQKVCDRLLNELANIPADDVAVLVGIRRDP